MSELLLWLKLVKQITCCRKTEIENTEHSVVYEPKMIFFCLSATSQDSERYKLSFGDSGALKNGWIYSSAQ